MEHVVLVLVATLLVIVAAAALAPRLGMPAQVILVLAGIAVSLVPAIPAVVIDPQVVLLGLLPALLYASATSMSATNFRRDFRAINGLSIVLVVLSSLALGALFAWLIPDLGFTWGVALGAILSPTDAVATSIIKGRGVPGRVVVILEGESLLNDASALIILRTAIVATTVGFSFWRTLGAFVFSVVVALVVGSAAAALNIAVRRRLHDEAVNTILSFTTPFAAAIPAELLHGSGLVAAVVAGLITGIKAPRDLPPGHRLSDARNWASLQLVLEGLVFLTMGLQLAAIFKDLGAAPARVANAVGMAVAALLITVLLRATYVVPLLWQLRRRARRWQDLQTRAAQMQRELDAGRIPEEVARHQVPWQRQPNERTLRRLASQLRRGIADIDYLKRQPLGGAEAAIVIWAGMRGAVTVAAAQMLPVETPHRPLLIFIAFTVAALSLLLQGGTIGTLVARLFAAGTLDASSHAQHLTEQAQIHAVLESAAARIERAEGMSDAAHRLAVLLEQRSALLDVRDEGAVDVEVLRVALLNVDVDELVLRLRMN